MMENQENKNEIKYPEELEKLYKEALDAFEEGNYTKAKLKFEEAIKYHEKHNIPYNIDALKILSHIYLLLNENEKAKAVIEKIIELSGEEDAAQVFKYAVALAQNKEFKEAKEILEDLLKEKKLANNEKVAVLNVLGNLNFELGNYKEAKKNFEEALKYTNSETIRKNLEYVENLLKGNN